MSTIQRAQIEGLPRRPVHHPLPVRSAPGLRRPAGGLGAGRAGAGLARPRVLLADDCVLWREGVARLLAESGTPVVGRVADVPGLLRAAVRTRPDVIVVDPAISTVGADDGVRALRWVRRRLPGTAVLVLEDLARQPSGVAAELGARSGGVGHLVKQRIGSAEELAAAVECVAMGGTVAAGRTDEAVSAPRSSAEAPGPLHALSRRELEVLALIAEGDSNAAIADRLGIAGKTVDSHVGRILAKVGLAEDVGVNRRVRVALLYLRSTAAAPR